MSEDFTVFSTTLQRITLNSGFAGKDYTEYRSEDLRERLEGLKTAAEKVMTCISWSDTREGGRFWSHIHTRIKELAEEVEEELETRRL